MAKDLRALVLEEIEKEFGNVAVVLGYLEHQLDLQAKLIKDLSAVVDQTKLTAETKALLVENDNLLAKTSVDFANLSSPLESYKLPQAGLTKDKMRKVQAKYLSKVLG